MADRSREAWVNDMTRSPKIEGNLEISTSRDGIFIGGDADALRSLARLLVWLADVDQESLSTQPDGERYHVHLHTRDAPGFNSLTPFSSETELCRLDAKGTGDFPERYRALGNGRGRKVKKAARKARTAKASQKKSKRVVHKRRAEKGAGKESIAGKKTGHR